MTLAPDVSPQRFRDLVDAVAVLRERGLRLTTPRRLVLEALFEADAPVSAEALAAARQIELTVVYRNLETLEAHGLARHVHLGHGPGLYVLVGRGDREYLYCERCGSVTALAQAELDPVREQIRTRFGYEVRFTHFPLTGRCASCLDAK